MVRTRLVIAVVLGILGLNVAGCESCNTCGQVADVMGQTNAAYLASDAAGGVVNGPCTMYCEPIAPDKDAHTGEFQCGGGCGDLCPVSRPYKYQADDGTVASVNQDICVGLNDVNQTLTAAEAQACAEYYAYKNPNTVYYTTIDGKVVIGPTIICNSAEELLSYLKTPAGDTGGYVDCVGSTGTFVGGGVSLPTNNNTNSNTGGTPGDTDPCYVSPTPPVQADCPQNTVKCDIGGASECVPSGGCACSSYAAEKEKCHPEVGSSVPYHVVCSGGPCWDCCGLPPCF